MFRTYTKVKHPKKSRQRRQTCTQGHMKHISKQDKMGKTWASMCGRSGMSMMHMIDIYGCGWPLGKHYWGWRHGNTSSKTTQVHNIGRGGARWWTRNWPQTRSGDEGQGWSANSSPVKQGMIWGLKNSKNKREKRQRMKRKQHNNTIKANSVITHAIIHILQHLNEA